MRVKSELRSDLFLPRSLSHSPIQVFRLRWYIVNSLVCLHSFLHPFLICPNSPKMHYSRTFTQRSVIRTLLKGRY